LILIAVAALISFYMARQGRIPDIRRFEPLDRIEEGVGRATEMGRPVHMTTGCYGDLRSATGAQIMAGLGVMSHIASLCAKSETAFFVNATQPDVYPLADRIVRDAYTAAGFPEGYKPEMVRFVGGSFHSAVSAIIGSLQRENVATSFYIGFGASDTLIICESAAEMGIFQVGGGGNDPYMVALNDYALIGDELFAARAYITKDPLHLANIQTSDVVKFAAIALVIIGTLLAAGGIETLKNILST
jgi:hypothetical protein